MAAHAVRNDGRIVKRITLQDGSKKDVYAYSPTELKTKVKEAMETAEKGVKLSDHSSVNE